MACAPTAECQAALDKQIPGIVQQLQDRDHGSTAFELAIEVGRASSRVAEAQAALSEAKEGETQAYALLQELQAAGGGNCTTAFELGRGISRARARVAEANAALSEAEKREAKANARLQEQLKIDPVRQPSGDVSDAYVGEIFAAYMTADDLL